MDKKLIKKFVEFGMGNFIVLIVGFISTPIITRIISPDSFGKSSMFNTITNIISVIILVGLDQAFVRFFYDEKEENRGKLLRVCIDIPCLLCIIINLIILFFYKPVSRLIVGEESIVLIAMLIVQNIFLMLSRFTLLVIRMKQKGRMYSFLQVMGKVSYLIFIAIIFKIKGDNYNTIIYAIVLSNITIVLIALFSEKKFWISGINNKNNLNTKTKDVLVFGFPLIFTLLINWVFQSIDKISINIFNGYNELGIYSSAFAIIALLNSLQVTFNTFWTPVSYERYKSNNEDRKFFENVSLIIAIIMLLVSIGLIFCKDLLIILLGEKYRSASYVVPFLVFIPLMNTVSETTVVGINFMKKPKYHIYIAIISCISNVIGNIILVPKLGAVGAAISTGIAYTFFYLSRTFLSAKLYKVNYNVKKFMISTIMLGILALYSSFNQIDYVYVFLTLSTLFTIIISYGKELTILVKKRR